jgi:hypothetical protein
MKENGTKDEREKGYEKRTENNKKANINHKMSLHTHVHPRVEDKRNNKR